MEMTSPWIRSAISIASGVLPDAVGPVITSTGDSRSPSKAALQLSQREAYDRGPAMHIVIGQLGGEELLEQVGHLTMGERLPGFDRSLAGKGHGNALMLIA